MTKIVKLMIKVVFDHKIRQKYKNGENDFDVGLNNRNVLLTNKHPFNYTYKEFYKSYHRPVLKC